MIVGHVTVDPQYRIESDGTDSYLEDGIFIVDYRKRKFSGGLNKQHWLTKLKPYGITREPELFAPDFRDEKRGRNKPQSE